MRHGAGRDEAVTTRGLDVARGLEASNRRHSRHVESSLDALRAPEGEVDDVASRRRDHAARGLAGDGGLEGDAVEQVRLDELRLGKRRGHLQQRLAREHDAAFGHAPYIAGEAELPECLEVALRELELVAEVANLVLV